jgi:hypothetical protein
MPAGLEVYDAAGVKILGTNDRLCRVLGSISISSNGSYTHTGLSNAGQPWAAFFSAGSFGALYYPAHVTISGDTITWTYPTGSSSSGRVMYGVR